VQRTEQHGRIDIALVIRAEHHRFARRYVPGADHPVSNPGGAERQRHAAVTEPEQKVFETQWNDYHEGERSDNEQI